MKLPALRWLAVLFFLFALTATASAEELFDNFVVFGDSLSDMGNGADAPVTNPGGQVWAYYFAKKFGINLSPSDNGGNDWAISGDQTGTGPGSQDGGMLAQVNNYLNSGKPVDPRGLYSLWAGANDLNQQLDLGVSYLTITRNSVGNLVSMLNQLHGAGARYIILFNIPYLGDTPLGRSNGPAEAEELNDITAYFNQYLTEKVNTIGYDVIQVDVAALLKAIYTDGTQNSGRKFGFTNVTDQFNQCTGSCDVTKYLFWNNEHPTDAAQQAIGEVVYEEIMAPLYAGLLAVAPISALDSQTSALENQLWTLRTRLLKVSTGQYSVFANSDYSPTDLSADNTKSPGYTSDSGSLNVGLLRRLNDHWVAGLALGRSEGDFAYTQNAGTFHLAQTMGAAFAGYQYNRFYADGIASLAWNDYTNINREVTVAAWNGLAAADTDGHQLGADLIAGYNLVDKNNFQSGPIGELDYQYIHVNAYTEHGADPENIQYFDQDNQSLVTNLGWQASYIKQKGNVTWMPFGKLTYNYQWINGDRDISAGIVTLPGSHYSIPFSTPDQGYMVAEAGISALVYKDINLSLDYSSTLLQKNNHTQNVGVSVQVAI